MRPICREDPHTGLGPTRHAHDVQAHADDELRAHVVALGSRLKDTQPLEQVWSLVRSAV